MHTTGIDGRKNCLLLVKTRGCWLIRLYSLDHFKAPTLESERGQTVIKLPLSLPYDGETSNCDAAVERFQNWPHKISVGHKEEGGRWEEEGGSHGRGMQKKMYNTFSMTCCDIRPQPSSTLTLNYSNDIL